MNKFALRLEDVEFTGIAEDTQIIGEYKDPMISVQGTFSADTFELLSGKVVTDTFQVEGKQFMNDYPQGEECTVETDAFSFHGNINQESFTSGTYVDKATGVTYQSNDYVEN